MCWSIVIPIGKYKGKTFNDTRSRTEALDYLWWAYNNVKWFKTTMDAEIKVVDEITLLHLVKEHIFEPTKWGRVTTLINDGKQDYDTCDFQER